MTKRQRKTSAALVLNHGAVAAPVAPALQHFTANRRTDKLVRNDKIADRAYIVVPMVMLVEGVLNGSQGALYYPAEELRKTPAVWNHKPVVVYHPEINGQGVSACDPDILTTHQIGIIMNTKFDKLGRLTAEAWIEPSRADAVDPRIMPAIEKNEMMELSTGLFTDNERVDGETEDGEKYSAIARNYRPDHLAVLPDKIGACSIKDGAGFIRNQLTTSGDGLEKSYLESIVRRALVSAGITDNELSYDNVRSRLYSLIAVKFKTGTDISCDCWIEDVFDAYFVYSKSGKLFGQGYRKTADSVDLEGEPSEVLRVTEYKKTTGGAFVGNQSTETKKEKTMDKKTIVDNLIANCGWAESEREFLMGLPDARLTIIDNQAKQAVANKTATAPAPVATNAAPAVVVPAKPISTQEYVNNAPAEIREMLNNSLAVAAQEKNNLITVITANKLNTFTKEQLEAMQLNQLKSIAALATQPAAAPAPNYSGLAPVTGNASDGPGEVLELPTMNFGKE